MLREELPGSPQYAQRVCYRLMPPERDLSGPAIEASTGIPAAHLRGSHLRLPGHGEAGPTLEVFTCDSLAVGGQRPPVAIHRPGFGHLAFSVVDVAATRAALLADGGQTVGEVVTMWRLSRGSGSRFGPPAEPPARGPA